MRRAHDQPELPVDFPAQLLAAEIALEQQGSAEQVSVVVNLYQQAIEYYEHHGDSRYLDYQARMHRIFTRPEILEHLSHLAQPTAPPPRPTTPPVTDAVELSATAPMKQGRKSQLLLEVQTKSTTMACRNVKKDVANQNSKLRSRLAKRREEGRASADFGKMNCRTSDRFLDHSPLTPISRPTLSRSPSCLSITESDKSGGIPKSPMPIDELAGRLEETMEKLCAERAISEMNIRINYEKQIAEMEKGMNGSKIVQQVIAKMRDNMEQDLHQLRQDMDSRSKAEAERITAEYSI